MNLIANDEVWVILGSFAQYCIGEIKQYINMIFEKHIWINFIDNISYDIKRSFIIIIN